MSKQSNQRYRKEMEKKNTNQAINNEKNFNEKRIVQDNYNNSNNSNNSNSENNK